MVGDFWPFATVEICILASFDSLQLMEHGQLAPVEEQGTNW